MNVTAPSAGFSLAKGPIIQTCVTIRNFFTVCFQILSNILWKGIIFWIWPKLIHLYILPCWHRLQTEGSSGRYAWIWVAEEISGADWKENFFKHRYINRGCMEKNMIDDRILNSPFKLSRFFVKYNENILLHQEFLNSGFISCTL